MGTSDKQSEIDGVMKDLNGGKITLLGWEYDEANKLAKEGWEVKLVVPINGTEKYVFERVKVTVGRTGRLNRIKQERISQR